MSFSGIVQKTSGLDVAPSVISITLFDKRHAAALKIRYYTPTVQSAVI
jgi:hypothetical protein